MSEPLICKELPKDEIGLLDVLDLNDEKHLRYFAGVLKLRHGRIHLLEILENIRRLLE